MRVLLTNDDGIEAEGLQALRRALLAVPGVELAVIAPDSNRSAIGRRSASPRRRDVSAIRALAPHAGPRCAGHHGGTSCRSATSHSHPASAAVNSGSRFRPLGGTDRPWYRFQVRTRMRG